MITSIRLVNFKNFVDETLRLGPFTMIVGTNASGKSNIRDAFRFLHGIGRGYTLPEIVGGKWGAGGQREWQPIRGAAHEVVRLDSESSTFEFHVDLRLDGQPVSYSIAIEFDPLDQPALTQLEHLQKIPLPQEALPVYAVPHGVVWRQWVFPSDPISQWGGDLREFLSEEGRKLGLFSDIVKVGSDGQHEIHVQQSGGWRNIVETGFGVSSIMPMLHAMYRQQEGTTFLLQQPEINVHPSAQARLAQMMAESPHRFVIETHSDHLIDRFRICVMEEVLAPDELRIAYFQREPDREGVVIYNISVDEDGNLDGAPAGYRKFFMDETDRLLGFGGR